MTRLSTAGLNSLSHTNQFSPQPISILAQVAGATPTAHKLFSWTGGIRGIVCLSALPISGFLSPTSFSGNSESLLSLVVKHTVDSVHHQCKLTLG